MKAQHFLKQLNRKLLVKAIQEAERDNSGDVVLYISHEKITEPVPAAQKLFAKLNLHHTEPQNSFLILLCPESRNFALIAGGDFHTKVTNEWWSTLTQSLSAAFKANELTPGLEQLLRKVGAVQRDHFPEHPNQDRTGQANLMDGEANSPV